MRIQHNIMAMNAYRNYTNNVSAMKANLEKLSSGYKINRAGDDAAGLAISEKMRAQITGLQTAQKNAKDGISLIQTAEGALTEVHDMLNRMVELASQSANGTYDNETDRAQMQKEIDQLRSEIDRIADSSNFNGINLLDGSMDADADMTQYSDKMQIADWVGSTQNSLATVGDGTIVHSGQQKPAATKFSVELNNSQVSGDNGVSITLGGNEALTLDASEIQEGASADEIAAAFAKKYGKDGVELLAQDGTTKVKFNVTAEGDEIVFEQAEAPTKAEEIVDSDMAVKYEGIGAVSTTGPAVTLNTTPVTLTASHKNSDAGYATGTAATDKERELVDNNTFVWADGASNEAKDALNKLLTDSKDTASVKVTGSVATGQTAIATPKADITALKNVLGEGYTVTATAYDPGAKSSADLEISDKGIIDLTKGGLADNKELHLTISDKDGNALGTMKMTLNTTAIGTTTADVELETTVALGAGATANTPAVATLEENGGKLFDDTATDYFAFDANITDEQKSALNEALGEDGAAIKFELSGLAGNKVDTANNGTKLTITLDQALTDAGYYLDFTDAGGNDNTKVESGKEIAIHASDDDAIANNAELELTLRDKDGNAIGTITTKDLTAANTTDLTSAASTITLAKSNFSVASTTAATADNVSEEASVTVKDKNGAEITVDDWTDGAANATLVADGVTVSVDIGGKTYTATLKNGGLTEEQTKSGEFIDISAMDGADDVLGALDDAIQKQLDAEAKEAASGTEDYKKYESLAFTAHGTNKNNIKIGAKVTEYTYSKAGGAADEGGSGETVGSTSGKDPNASTTKNVTGQIADAGRLASTYITQEDLAGLKDGSQLTVGGTTYTFAVGKDSQVSGDNVIDLKDMTAADADLTQKALERLSNAANEMFSIGYDKGRLTFTENKEYTWGEGVDLSTHEGIAKQFAFSVDGQAKGRGLTLQISDTADSYNQLKVNIKDMHASSLDLSGLDISTQEGATAAISKIKAAINTVSDVRGTLGATQNRLDHTINNLSVMTENIQDAESTIRDVDVAEEMMEYTKNNILIQSAQAMLAQANQVPQGVLQLLQ